MKCHVLNGEVERGNIVHHANSFQSLASHPVVVDILNASESWRSDPLYLRACQNDVYPLYILDDGTIKQGTPVGYVNYDNAEDARHSLKRHYPVTTASVMCVMSGKKYPSMTAAALDHDLRPAAVSIAVKTGKPIKSKKLGVYTWFTLPSNPKPLQPIQTQAYCVECVDTGSHYSSVTKAAIDHGITPAALSIALRMDKPVTSKVLNRKVMFKRMNSI